MITEYDFWGLYKLNDSNLFDKKLRDSELMFFHGAT
jgi:hypothetical protein